MQLYVYLNGEKRGPFSDEQLRRMLAERVLTESDFAATAIDGEWKALRNWFGATQVVEALVPSACSPTEPRGPATVQAVDTTASTARVPVAPANESLGNYARATLGPNESVFYKTSVHWIVFVHYIVLALLVLFFVAIPFGIAVQAFTRSQIGWFALPFPMFILVPPSLLYWTSELVVTNRRVLIKTGAIRRQTLEMFISKIESVGVDQGFLGRFLDFGTVVIRGTGGSEEPFQNIAHPIAFRNAVQRLQTDHVATPLPA